MWRTMQQQQQQHHMHIPSTLNVAGPRIITPAEPLHPPHLVICQVSAAHGARAAEAVTPTVA